jgi:hypothetical protein
VLVVLGLGVLPAWGEAAAAVSTTSIVVARGASPLEVLAAREVRRYVYQRTGTLLHIQSRDAPPRHPAIVVGRSDRSLLRRSSVSALGISAQEFALVSEDRPTGRLLVLVGGDAVGTLYAAYRFAEHLGVRFYLHGDVVPDDRVELRLPSIAEREAPRFRLRGILPFHDFPEGPDWWNLDDYRAVVAQLPKLRLNFLGLHTYPEGEAPAEPTVWIGTQNDVGRAGRVRFAYPASYYTTARQGWGYEPKPTSSYSFGASALFDTDDFGATVMAGAIPEPATQDASRRLFDRTGAMLGAAFRYARSLGVATCVGTEVPLTVPAEVASRIRRSGGDAHSPQIIERLYEGMFRRIARTYPLSYYWLWTPERWLWFGATVAEGAAAVDDIQIALRAAARVRAPFRLATGGWTLGLPSHPAYFDEHLPRDVPMSALVGALGRDPIPATLLDMPERETWMIPWLEDDGSLTAPQLWVGRMLQNVGDAARYGVDGIMGIHWHTKGVGPEIGALAAAAWTSDEPSAVAFYLDWARQSFCGAVADDVAAIFARIDGNLPLLSSFATVAETDAAYAFVDELVALRERVVGTSSAERFDEWLDAFTYQRAAARAVATAIQYDAARQQVGEMEDAASARRAAHDVLLPLRMELVGFVGEAMRHLLAFASTTGDLGTIATWEQLILPTLLDRPGAELADLLGDALPPETDPSPEYEGPPRIIVPTSRGSVFEGEALPLRVLVLGKELVTTVTAHWRRFGGQFHASPLRHVDRGVYIGTLPDRAARGAGFEYYVEVRMGEAEPVRFPRGAPERLQTVVVNPWRSPTGT